MYVQWAQGAHTPTARAAFAHAMVRAQMTRRGRGLSLSLSLCGWLCLPLLLLVRRGGLLAHATDAPPLRVALISTGQLRTAAVSFPSLQTHVLAERDGVSVDAFYVVEYDPDSIADALALRLLSGDSHTACLVVETRAESNGAATNWFHTGGPTVLVRTQLNTLGARLKLRVRGGNLFHYWRRFVVGAYLARSYLAADAGGNEEYDVYMRTRPDTVYMGPLDWRGLVVPHVRPDLADVSSRGGGAYMLAPKCSSGSDNGISDQMLFFNARGLDMFLTDHRGWLFMLLRRPPDAGGELATRRIVERQSPALKVVYADSFDTILLRRDATRVYAEGRSFRALFSVLNSHVWRVCQRTALAEQEAVRSNVSHISLALNDCAMAAQRAVWDEAPEPFDRMRDLKERSPNSAARATTAERGNVLKLQREWRTCEQSVAQGFLRGNTGGAASASAHASAAEVEFLRTLLAAEAAERGSHDRGSTASILLKHQQQKPQRGLEASRRACPFEATALALRGLSTGTVLAS